VMEGHSLQTNFNIGKDLDAGSPTKVLDGSECRTSTQVVFE